MSLVPMVPANLRRKASDREGQAGTGDTKSWHTWARQATTTAAACARTPSAGEATTEERVVRRRG